MRLGVATKDDLLSNADVLARAGFDYIELSLMAVERLELYQYKELCRQSKDCAIKPELFQSMLPADYLLTGPDVQLSWVRDYLLRAMERAAELGCKLVVFGSAGARRCPGEWPKERAMQQLIEFADMACKVFSACNVSLGVEQIAPFETNMINTLEEAEEICRGCSEKNIGLVPDLAHMELNGIRPEAIEGVQNPLLHAHIARPDGRLAPMPEDGCEELYRRFICMVKAKGVNRLSVETGGCNGVDSVKAITVGKYLKELVK